MVVVVIVAVAVVVIAVVVKVLVVVVVVVVAVVLAHRAPLHILEIGRASCMCSGILHYTYSRSEEYV